jgi:energy-coupling factor transporter ATP-binding protein EcfA2
MPQTTVEIREFILEDIPMSCTWLIVGPPASGKTTLVESFCYYLKHRYPVARVFMGTEGSYKKFCAIMPPLFVSLEFDEQEEKNHILRQRKCKIENPDGYPGNYAINIIDDASDDPKVYKTKTMRGLFKLGSQHWNQLLMVGSQYAIDLPPDIRKSVSYVAIFREPEEAERKKLYINLGGSCGKYETFCELMDQITGDYSCMIIKKRSQSNKMEDNVFYMKTKVLKDWKFGCKEYREWGKNRYNTKFVDDLIV